MLDIPSALQEQFEEFLQNKPIPNSSRKEWRERRGERRWSNLNYWL